jgi:chromosomal replication initiator protein
MSIYPQTFDLSSVLPPTEMLKKQWDMVKDILRQELGSDVVKSWMDPLVLAGLQGTNLCFYTNNVFSKDWIENNYLTKISKLFSDMNGCINSIILVVNSKLAPFNINHSIYSPSSSVNSSDGNQNGSASEETYDYMEAALDSRFTFENFVVGKPNELAYVAALRVAESTVPQFNPLFLYGGVGLGKTHLMHAIAWKIREKHPNRKVIYLSAEKFMYQFVRALRYKDTVAFKEQFRTVDVLMVDDVQFISGKDNTQEEFFHTFNALVDQNHQVIVSADKSPSDLENMKERLKSRLGWGLVADIHPTTYELRLGILQAKVDSLKATVPKEVIEFLAFKITSNIRELEGALNRILAHSDLVGRAITLDSAQDLLRDLLRSNEIKLSIEEIQRKVAEYYNIKMSDMVSTRRLQNLARPRQVAMYMSKILTSKSLPEIGRKFGGRDHTTVLHAFRKVQELSQQDPEFNTDLEILRRSLER